jgi:hypothetical protein
MIKENIDSYAGGKILPILRNGVKKVVVTGDSLTSSDFVTYIIKEKLQSKNYPNNGTPLEGVNFG